MPQGNVIVSFPALPSLQCHKGCNSKVRTEKLLLMSMIQHPFLTALILVFYSFINEITSSACHFHSASLSAAALGYPAFQGEKLGLCLIKQSFTRVCEPYYHLRNMH